jgi:hypothetical protein
MPARANNRAGYFSKLLYYNINSAALMNDNLILKRGNNGVQ